MCSSVNRSHGRPATSAEKIQIYFDVATKLDGENKRDNQGRRGTPSRNIHLAEILGEDIDEGVLLESNVHDGLLGGDEDPPQEEFDWETYEAYATFIRGMKMNKATWDSLSPEAKGIWDQLLQKDKNTILKSRPGMVPRNPRSIAPHKSTARCAAFTTPICITRSINSTAG